MPGRSCSAAARPAVIPGGRSIASCASEASTCTRPSLEGADAEPPRGLAELAGQRAGRDLDERAARRPAARGARVRGGSAAERSGWASRMRQSRCWSSWTSGSSSAETGENGHSTSRYGPPPSDSARSASSSRSASRDGASSPPGHHLERRRRRPGAPRAPRPGAPGRRAGSVANMWLTCEVAASTRVPASTAARASSTASSSEAGPSSTPGRMWACRSITPSQPRRVRWVTTGVDGANPWL